MKYWVFAAAMVFLGVTAIATPAHADRGYYRGGGYGDRWGGGRWGGDDDRGGYFGGDDDGGFFMGMGAFCCANTSYYYSGYPSYYAPPPTVVYTPPAAYVAPPATYYGTSAPYVPPASAVSATQASPTFVDKKGRTCRTFRAPVDGETVNGTACLQPNGTWRTVGE